MRNPIFQLLSPLNETGSGGARGIKRLFGQGLTPQERDALQQLLQAHGDRIFRDAPGSAKKIIWGGEPSAKLVVSAVSSALPLDGNNAAFAAETLGVEIAKRDKDAIQVFAKAMQAMDASPGHLCSILEKFPDDGAARAAILGLLHAGMELRTQSESGLNSLLGGGEGAAIQETTAIYAKGAITQILNAETKPREQKALLGLRQCLPPGKVLSDPELLSKAREIETSAALGTALSKTAIISLSKTGKLQDMLEIAKGPLLSSSKELGEASVAALLRYADSIKGKPAEIDGLFDNLMLILSTTTRFHFERITEVIASGPFAGSIERTLSKPGNILKISEFDPALHSSLAQSLFMQSPMMRAKLFNLLESAENQEFGEALDICLRALERMDVSSLPGPEIHFLYSILRMRLEFGKNDIEPVLQKRIVDAISLIPDNISSGVRSDIFLDFNRNEENQKYLHEIRIYASDVFQRKSQASEFSSCHSVFVVIDADASFSGAVKANLLQILKKKGISGIGISTATDFGSASRLISSNREKVSCCIIANPRQDPEPLKGGWVGFVESLKAEEIHPTILVAGASKDSNFKKKLSQLGLPNGKHPPATHPTTVVEEIARNDLLGDRLQTFLEHLQIIGASKKNNRMEIGTQISGFASHPAVIWASTNEFGCVNKDNKNPLGANVKISCSGDCALIQQNKFEPSLSGGRVSLLVIGPGAQSPELELGAGSEMRFKHLGLVLPESQSPEKGRNAARVIYGEDTGSRAAWAPIRSEAFSKADSSWSLQAGSKPYRFIVSNRSRDGGLLIRLEENLILS